MLRPSDAVDGGGGQRGLVQVIKVWVGHGLARRDPLGRIVDQHFLKDTMRVIEKELLDDVQKYRAWL